MESLSSDTRDAAINEEKNLKNQMINFVAEGNKAFFKSQQIDDPELNLNERKQILENILENSHATFLSRFGPYLNSEHYQYFEKQNYHPEEKYEIQHYLDELRNNNEKCNTDVKNRRYEALQKLIKEGEYFSEIEMMKREPLLYEQLIGQYLTESEMRVRDGIDTTSTFLNTLLEGIDRDHIKQLRKKQEKEEEEQIESNDESLDIPNSFKLPHHDDDATEDDESDDDKFPKINPNFRKQWGNFEDETTMEFGKQKKKSETNFKYVNSEEREMLREEFYGIMYSKFLSGYDKNFDYTKIDKNFEFDNLVIKSQDKEDQYFDSEEISKIEKNSIENAESEDELDKYMKKISEEVQTKPD